MDRARARSPWFAPLPRSSNLQVGVAASPRTELRSAWSLRRAALLSWALALAACLCAVSPTKAQSENTDPVTQPYDIKAQPLYAALMELGTISRVDILYENGVVDGKRSTAVSGLHTPSTAIDSLLRGTGLLFRFTSETAVLVFPPDRPPDPAERAQGDGAQAPRLLLDVLRVTAPTIVGTSSRERFEPFGRAVRDAINQRLQDDPRTSARAFRARLAVHLDGQGGIERLNITQTTGDAQLDRNIRLVLAGARMPSSPPPDLPQPLWFDIAAR